MPLILANLFTDFGVTVPKLLAQVITFGIVYMVLNRYAFGPVMAMLEARRKRIAEGEAKLEKIARDLAAAEENARAILDKANNEGSRLIKEAGDSAGIVAERKKQDAVAEANNIMAKAREAARLEQEQLLAQLKREFGRMVVDATSRVTGKVLNNDDQERINRETAAQVSM
jgi:F-type H+-transporting ATPase subunit b